MASIQIYPYLSPRIIKVLAPDTEVSVQELVDLCRDWEDDDTNVSMSFERLIDAAGKEDLGGGVSVGITASLNNAQVMFEPRTTKLDDGVGRTCDANDTYGRQLYVDDATFVTNGVERGDLIYNVTTGAYATVLEVVDENTINHMELEGGSSAEWTIGDNYIVYDTEQCNISGGNLVAVDTLGADISATLYSFGTQIIKSSSSSATLQELEAIQFSSYDGGITIDVANTTGKATSGVVYPTGTPRQPVNNLDDLLLLLTSTGLGDVYVIGDLTIPTGYDFTNIRFIGQSALKTTITLDVSSTVDGAEFKDATITGSFEGNHVVEECIITAATDLSGLISSSGLTDTLSLKAGVLTELWEIKSRVPGISTPVVDMNSTAILSCRDYEGGIKFINYSGSSAHTISLAEGQIILDSATITGGTWVVRGIGKLIDENGSPIDSDVDGDNRPIPTIWNGTVTILNELLTAGAVGGGGSSPWSTAEKDQLITDTEIVKDQSKIAALHAVNQLNTK